MQMVDLGKSRPGNPYLTLCSSFSTTGQPGTKFPVPIMEKIRTLHNGSAALLPFRIMYASENNTALNNYPEL